MQMQRQGIVPFSCSFVEAHKFVSGVLFKLIIFSLSLGIVPLSSYFLSLKYIWNGEHLFISSNLFVQFSHNRAENATFAAITAVVSANIVLVAYIITSVLEDKQVSSKTLKEKSEGKKDK